MTMRIVFKKDHGPYKEGDVEYIERSLAVSLCNDDKAMTYTNHLDEVYEAEQAEKKEKEENKAKKKEKLIKSRSSKKKEKAISKKEGEKAIN